MKLDLRWFAAFSFLLLAVHEAHELAHAVTARVVCGAWPLRDFNAWRFAGECNSILPTTMGPLFSYALMLAGALIAGRRARFGAGGIALLFAANPFARIFTAVMGGGDEMVVARWLAGVTERTPLLRVAVLAFVLLVCGSAIVFAWRAMRGVARRGIWFALALLWPMALTGVALFVIGNRLLHAGVMADRSISGAPLLVVLVSAAAAVLAMATVPWLSARTRAAA
ncbi:MAG TPA: hypothetical protein VND45_01825 [Thermoanaerobaculia bacterium]|jgi:hypothetical protein|nr:hypothetical protein [Thermoanaerobaculia bacterium]